MLEVKITGTEGIQKSALGFKQARAELRERIFTLLMDFGNDTVATIKKDYLTGPRPGKLGVGTGRLRSSIRFQAVAKDDQMTVTFGSDVPYAAIHEFGGTTKPHVIRPKRKPFLSFMKDGKWIYTKKDIQHPGSVIPPRPFLTPGVAQEFPKLQKRIAETLQQVANGAFGGQ